MITHLCCSCLACDGWQCILACGMSVQENARHYNSKGPCRSCTNGASMQELLACPGWHCTCAPAASAPQHLRMSSPSRRSCWHVTKLSGLRLNTGSHKAVM